MHDEINEVDLAFVVDTTASMGSLIATAQQQMVSMLRELSGTAEMHLQLGVVEYRDHPPQDPMIYRVYQFTDDLDAAQNTIMALQASGGGDPPEAVLDGIMAACQDLAWRKQAYRLVLLVGDAPPHGVGVHGDAFRDGCPCGETIASITRRAEEERIIIHALGLTTDVETSFREISTLTGGQFFAAQQSKQAIEHMATLLKAEFAGLDLDRRVFALYRTSPELEPEAMAELLGTSRHSIFLSLVRLLSRDLIEAPSLES